MSNHTTPSSPEQVRISQDVANIKRIKAWRIKRAVVYRDNSDGIIYPQDVIYPVHDDESMKKYDFLYDFFWGFVITASTIIVTAIFLVAAYFIITI